MQHDEAAAAATAAGRVADYFAQVGLTRELALMDDASAPGALRDAWARAIVAVGVVAVGGGSVSAGVAAAAHQHHPATMMAMPLPPGWELIAGPPLGADGSLQVI